MRMMKMLTSEWNQAAERPRPGSKVGSQTFVQVKLSNRELIHSLGISYTGKSEDKVAGFQILKKIKVKHTSYISAAHQKYL